MDIDHCPAAYVLHHYSGDTCGLCDPGGYCNLRVHNRMFCDCAPPVHAKDYRADAGTDAGAGS